MIRAEILPKLCFSAYVPCWQGWFSSLPLHIGQWTSSSPICYFHYFPPSHYPPTFSPSSLSLSPLESLIYSLLSIPTASPLSRPIFLLTNITSRPTLISCIVLSPFLHHYPTPQFSISITRILKYTFGHAIY